MKNVYLSHHGILGMHWGIRRYQNEDGTLTEAGRRRLERKDLKWAKRNEDKITKKVMKKSSKEMNNYVKKELNYEFRDQIRSGRIGQKYVNAYNKKLTELMNKNVGQIETPSGRVVQFVAKRGDMEVGVYMALADKNYDMSNLKNGVYSSGRKAYTNNNVNMANY